VLVHAGAGGVGICAIQIAKAMGARVIATAGSADKLRVCKEVGGADYAVNYRDKDWQDQVKSKSETREYIEACSSAFTDTFPSRRSLQKSPRATASTSSTTQWA
jgi:NADPH:quinone reductase-like Zn-dependent oxidoreductase